MKKRLAKLLAAVAVLATGAASMGCIWLVIDVFFNKQLLVIRTKELFASENSLTRRPAAISSVDVIIIANMIQFRTFKTIFILYNFLRTNKIEVFIKLID